MPIDFYLTARHVFAYIVPGTLWIVGLLLWFGHRPDKLADYWLTAVLAALAAYIVGFTVHGQTSRVLFPLADKLAEKRRRTPDARFELARELLLQRFVRHGASPAVVSYVQQLDRRRVAYLCKKIVLERSRRLAHELDDYEGFINLIVGLASGLVVVAAGAIRYSQLYNIELYTSLVVVGWAAMFFALVVVVLPDKRLREELTMCENYMLLELGCDPDATDGA
jgi:hypothetical protein